MIFRNLLRRKTRTFLTMVGIAIGVAAVVALGAIAEGFINSYTTVLTSSGADIILTQGDAADIILSAVDDSVGPQVATVGGVKQVAGVILGMITTPDVPYFIVFGLDPNEFAMRHYKVVEGQPVTGPRQVLMGKTAAKNFKKKIGDNFKIQEVSYRIVGIYETGQGVEEMGAVIPLKEAQAVFKKPRQVTYYQIKVQRPDMTDVVIKELGRRFAKLAASRSANYMDNLQETQMLRAMSWFIGLLAVLAGGLGMMNTMLMSVFERTREIGVLRALGWRRGRVLRLILGEAFVLSLLGGLLGVALGLAMIYWVNQLPVLAGFLDNAFSFTLFVQAMLVALFLGAMGGLYPAWRAARLQPVEAMRYESGSGGAQAAGNLPKFGGIALRNVFRQRTRTLLTTLAIGVGVGLVVALGGMADGFVAQLSTMGGKSGELTVSEAKASDMSLAAIEDKVGRWITTLPAVEQVSGMLFGVASVPGTPYFLVLGMEPTGYAIRHFAITEGERLRAPREMLLGKVTAKNLKKKVGDSLQVSGTTFRIVGIYETGTGYEDGASVISLAEAQSIFKKPNQVTLYYVKLKDTRQIGIVRQQIEARWSQVSVSKSSEYADKTNDVQTFRSMANALSFISVLVGGVGIMNAMLMSVYERTREIGTLRALGWQRRRVIGMILRESATLSFMSGLTGIVLGVGLGWLLSLEPTMGVFLKGNYSLRLFIQAMSIALVLGGVGALYPAWRAASLSPIEALRYE
jgi:ABC-type antimicrobial peptide transport system permease subunit